MIRSIAQASASAIAQGIATIVRRAAYGVAVSAGLLAVAAPVAHARYPSQPIRIIVPFGPGGLADISMRLVAQKMGERYGEKMIVENRPGAGGIVAGSATLNAARDGYTFIAFSNGTAISKSLFKLPYDPVTDFTPVSTVAYFDLILVTKANGSLHSVADVLAEARKRPIVLGTINPGSTQNLSAELFKSTSGLNASIIPFKTTSDVVAALIRGDVDVAFESYAAVKGIVDAGQIVPIAATGTKRSDWLPKVPTVRESGLDYDVTGWNAIFAAKGVPDEAVQLINSQLNEVLRMPEVKQRFLDLGTEAKGSTPAEIGAILRGDVDKWGKVIQQAGIQRQ
ncbi:Bug family tripartite tricarboxylate transporter substrate binding protein [Bordetella bronchialis]|uniref:Bug family tripartite tricarboxylate transporter substrate binding protein n=1 Tax=Bordetella bronchialis TaxID=463025 RepID=UPI0009F5684E|nr:tripartite tricarboxylate transporter substrate-binding protein [Bordetella bronchialis]